MKRIQRDRREKGENGKSSEGKERKNFRKGENKIREGMRREGGEN